MSERLTFVVPMKLWTPGLYGFRSKYLKSERSMIPAHIELCSVGESTRFERADPINVSERLRELRRQFSTFEYTLSELGWDEESKELYLEPEPSERFTELRDLILESFGLGSVSRRNSRMRLVLADRCDCDAYLLKEAFEHINGGLLPLRCRATEIEVYRFQEGDWLLRESVSLQESEDN